MASTREFLDFVLDQLSELEGVTYRPMMGEYVLYYDGKVVGGVYDDRLLLKLTPGVPDAVGDALRTETPYPGAAAMLAPDVDDREMICRLVRLVADELPAPKPKKPKGERK